MILIQIVECWKVLSSSNLWCRVFLERFFRFAPFWRIINPIFVFESDFKIIPPFKLISCRGNRTFSKIKRFQKFFGWNFRNFRRMCQTEIQKAMMDDRPFEDSSPGPFSMKQTDPRNGVCSKDDIRSRKSLVITTWWRYPIHKLRYVSNRCTRGYTVYHIPYIISKLGWENGPAESQKSDVPSGCKKSCHRDQSGVCST